MFYQRSPGCFHTYILEGLQLRIPYRSHRYIQLQRRPRVYLRPLTCHRLFVIKYSCEATTTPSYTLLYSSCESLKSSSTPCWEINWFAKRSASAALVTYRCPCLCSLRQSFLRPNPPPQLPPSRLPLPCLTLPCLAFALPPCMTQASTTLTHLYLSITSSAQTQWPA